MTDPAMSPRPPDRVEIERSATRIGRYRSAALAVASVIGLIVVPSFGINDDVLLTMSTIFMWIILSSSWNFISGFTGYVDFGHGVFFGVGGYVTGILMVKVGLPFAPTVPLAALISAALALVIGYPLLRLRGVYFSIAMLGLFLAMRELVAIAKPLTAGAQGLILPAEVDRLFFYFLFLAGAVVVVALAVGLVLRRRQHVDVPTQPEYAAPTQLDRNDFADRDAPWLVVVFSSTRCDVCADVVRKALEAYVAHNT